MRFASPWALMALLIIPVYLYFQLRRQKTPALRYSATELMLHVGSSWRQQLFHLPLFLRTTALILLIIGLARPQQGIEKVYDISHGIAIEMVTDRSSSMGEEMVIGNRETNRLEVVKQVFAEFVAGNGRELKGRPNDLIGLITFARFPETACPLTLAHDALSNLMENVQLVNRRDEDGTSIGDGIALAAARLQKADETLAKKRQENPGSTYEIKSKIIILLTDGAHNSGSLTPLAAAELAKQWGIKIYTIGIGEDTQPGSVRGFFARMNQLGRGVDKKTLQEIADTTGGIFRLADDAKGLRSIYKEIDQLEKSEIESVRHMDYAEYFRFFVLTALGLLVAETILRATLFRKIP